MRYLIYWALWLFLLLAPQQVTLAVVGQIPLPAKVSDGFIVKFASDVSRASQVHTLNSAGAKVVERFALLPQLAFVKAVSGQRPADSMRLLQASPGVVYVEPDYLIRIARTPNDARFNEQYGLNNNGQNGGAVDADIDATDAWDITTGNRVAVAVIDTGVDYNHEDLANNIWNNPNEIADNGIDDDNNGFIDDVRGWDFANNDNDPMDDHGHGTHVSGIIAAQGDNGIGVAGVNWSARILPLKFIDRNGVGSTSNAIRAINYAVSLGVRLSNSSWGGGGYSQALFDTVQAAGKAGHLMIAAAGNDGQNSDDPANVPSYPAAYDLNNVIAVAATDNQDKLPVFSNWGVVSTDLAAPGVRIFSTMPKNLYVALDGTSMAAPFVTGAAALLLAKQGDLQIEQIRAAILSNVDTVPALSGMVSTGGRLNTFRALNSISGGVQIRPNNVTLAVGSRQIFVASNGAPPYSYSVTNSAIGQINSNSGEFVALQPGVTQISVTDSTGLTAVTGDVQVVQLTISPSQGQLKVGDFLPLMAAGGTAPYRWTSSVPTVASIDPNSGVLMGLSSGQTVVSVQDLNGLSASSGAFTVLALPSMFLAPMTAAIQPGETLQFAVTGGTAPYRWSVSDSNVATIDANGLMTGIAAGLVRVTVTDALNVAVTSNDINVDGIFVSIQASTLRVKQSVSLAVVGGLPPYQWRVTNSNIASVDKNGVLTALLPGSVKVNIMDAKGRVGRSQIIFVTDGAVLSMFARDKAITLGGTTTVKVSGGVAPFRWSIDNSKVLSLDENTGIVTGLNPGSATLTVSDASGQTASAMLDVRQMQITPTTANLSVGDRVTFSASGGVAPLKWSVNSATLANITDQGVLTALAPGSLTVSVTDADGASIHSGQIAIYGGASAAHIVDIKPYTATLSSRSTTPLKFAATGGLAPYTFQLSNNAVGTINSATGEFVVYPNAVGTTIIYANDADGHSAQSGIVTVQ